jgi:hypothetical protein
VEDHRCGSSLPWFTVSRSNRGDDGAP